MKIDFNPHIEGFSGIDKALQDLQNEAHKLGFDVEIIFNPKK